MRKAIAAMILGSLVALLVGCGGGASGGSTTQEVTITTSGTELKFNPATVDLKANTAVKLTYDNKSSQEHDLNIEGITTKEGAPVAIKVAGGKTGTATFTPTKAGDYTAVCSVPGHKDGGMTAKVSVK